MGIITPGSTIMEQKAGGNDKAGKSGKCLSASLQGLTPPVQYPVKTGPDQTWASALYSYRWGV